MKLFPIAIGLGGFAAAFVAVAFGGNVLTAFGLQRAKCEDPAAIETLKSLTQQRLHSFLTARPLMKSGSPYRQQESAIKAVEDGESPQLVVSAIRDRGEIGKTGISCAAKITAQIMGYTAEINTEYSVEPTKDSNTMVTARFSPGSG